MSMPTLADLHLLKKEIEFLGETLAAERLEHRAELGRVKLQLDTIKRYLEEHFLGFENRFEAIYREEKQRFNPEKDREKNQRL